jgi:hypothetical protein
MRAKQNNNNNHTKATTPQEKQQGKTHTMNKLFFKAALLALAGTALVTASAKAQFSGTYTQGDFLLGFRATGGTGSGSDVLVDLGPLGNFQTPTTFSTPNLDSLLVSTFGSGWFTRSDLLYGAAAAAQPGVDANGNTFYGTAPETVGGSESVLWPRPTISQAIQLKGKVNAEGQGYQNGSPTVSSPAIVQNTSDINSYASYQPGGTTPNSGGISYAYFVPDIEASNPSTTKLDVIQLVPTVGAPLGVDVGDITINGSGVVTFKPDSAEAAVPEPSTVATMVLGAGLLIAVMRWRKLFSVM